MRKIKYKYLSCQINKGTGMEDLILDTVIDYSESNLEIAKREAYNGEYKIYDDEQTETYQPTIQEQLDAQAAAILELMGVNTDD